MVLIDSTRFGEVVIDGERHGDVLIIEGRVRARDKEALRERHGTSHRIGDDEAQQLLTGPPDIVIIGTGQSGALTVDERTEDAIRRRARLILLKTPQAIERFNEFSRTKRVNALIHTTC